MHLEPLTFNPEKNMNGEQKDMLKLELVKTKRNRIGRVNLLER